MKRKSHGQKCALLSGAQPLGWARTSRDERVVGSGATPALWGSGHDSCQWVSLVPQLDFSKAIGAPIPGQDIFTEETRWECLMAFYRSQPETKVESSQKMCLKWQSELGAKQHVNIKSPLPHFSEKSSWASPACQKNRFGTPDPVTDVWNKVTHRYLVKWSYVVGLTFLQVTNSVFLSGTHQQVAARRYFFFLDGFEVQHSGNYH